MKHVTHLAALCCFLMCCFSAILQAEDIFALTASNKLVRFDSGSPGAILSSQSISGLKLNEKVLGIDFRPATGQLFALGDSSTIYIVNVTTGAATVLNAVAFTPALSGARFGIDFNPTVDRIRCMSDTAQNLRLNPNDGSVAGTDTGLNYASFDAGFGTSPRVVSAAYTNNNQFATSTTLYAIDSTADTLVTVGSINSTVSPNGGKIFTVGSLGFNTTDAVGFDISGQSGIAYASLTGTSAATSGLYSINLNTGAAGLIGAIGGGEAIVDIAVVTPSNAFDLVILRTGTPSTLVRLDSRFPQITTAAITIGPIVNPGDTIQSIAYRPADGILYGISGQNRIYAIDAVTGFATVKGTGALSPSPTDMNFAANFNPVADRLRVVDPTDENFRVNVDTGIVEGAPPAFDTALDFPNADVNGAANPNIVGVGYTNHVAGAATTTLFAIDANTDSLVTVNPPNNGQLNTIDPAGTKGLLGIDVTGPVGFDITPGGTAFLAALIGGTPTLYTVNLTTGAATALGTIGTTSIRSLAAISGNSIPSLQFSAAAFSVNEGSVGAVTVTRTGSSSGNVSVDYAVTAGTAVAGTNFTAVTGTLTFLNGETTRTILVPTLDDKLPLLTLTANVKIVNPIGSKLGAQTTATLNITGKSEALTIAINAGNNQSATINTSVAVAPSVLVKDQFGANVADGTDVAFTVASGGGTITGGAAKTAGGIATLGSWKLGATVGANTLSVTSATAPALTITATGTAVPVIVIASAPTAVPNPAVVQQSVVFSAAATGVPGATVVFAWNFGDNTTGSGASVAHTYAAAGTYNATLTLTDGVSTAATATLSVVVNPAIAVAGNGADSDGDGYSDAIEKEAATDPLSASSNPSGGKALAKLVLIQASLKISKSKKLALNGTLVIPAGFKAGGAAAIVDVGGYTRKFDLNEKASGKSTKDTLKISIKSKKGVVEAQTSKFTLSLNNVPDSVKADSPVQIVIGNLVFSK